MKVLYMKMEKPKNLIILLLIGVIIIYGIVDYKQNQTINKLVYTVGELNAQDSCIVEIFKTQTKINKRDFKAIEKLKKYHE